MTLLLEDGSHIFYSISIIALPNVYQVHLNNCCANLIAS